MSLGYNQSPDYYENALEYLNYFFVVFNLEAIIKISAWGSSYFWDRWNEFDFIIVIGTDIGILVQHLVLELISVGLLLFLELFGSLEL